MDITLVTSIMNNDVHGTDNDKKTGCGINLQKGDNINKYRRGGKMTDLKEITCERCKNAFAKKMIKADKKEMARLLKEERQREKAGLADEGIVPLGGTVAKITSVSTVNEPDNVPETVNQASENQQPKQVIAGTGVALDDSLAKFNITPPTEEPTPEAKNDDFMSQFAIPKPEPEKEEVKPAVNNSENDFLAQFAINVPKQNEPEEIQSDSDDFADEGSIDFSEINPPPSVYEESDEIVPETDERPVGIIDEDDIMKMFAFGNVKASSSQSPAVDNSSYNYVTPVSEESAPIPEPVEEVSIENDFSENSDFGYVANKLFGNEENEQSESYEEEPNEMTDIELPSLEEEIVPVQEDIIPEVPAIEDIELPPLEEILPIQEDAIPEVSAIDDIELPSLEETEPVQENVVPEIPILDDIELPSLEEVEPVHEEFVPEVSDIELPSFEETEQVEVEPIQEETISEVPVVDNIELPENQESEELEQEEIVEETSVPSLDDMITFMQNEENQSSQEVEQAEESIEEITEPIISPEPAVPEQPVIPQTPVQPVQPVQPIPTPVQPVYPQQPIYPQQPVFPQQTPYTQQPVVGQIVNVPQFNGYDQNNQPVYVYVQMQLTGYSANGQPIYVPFGQPAMQQPVMQQPFVQPVATPTPQVQVTPPVQTPPVTPESENQPLTPGQKIAAAAAAKGGMPATASNISKIAVHEHSRSTSQVFINAIAESKEYANKSLTETQGNQARNMPIINSIEDMLSAMGDNSEKEKRLHQESLKKNVPVYQEFTTPTNKVRTTSKSQKTEEPKKPLSKAELREKKKQDKIDAKFKKDLAKRGF